MRGVAVRRQPVPAPAPHRQVRHDQRRGLGVVAWTAFEVINNLDAQACQRVFEEPAVDLGKP